MDREISKLYVLRERHRLQECAVIIDVYACTYGCDSMLVFVPCVNLYYSLTHPLSSVSVCRQKVQAAYARPPDPSASVSVCLRLWQEGGRRFMCATDAGKMCVVYFRMSQDCGFVQKSFASKSLFKT